MKNELKINVPLLKEMVDKKYVWEHRHPTLPLTIYDYSKACTYEKIWNEVTILCRGLVLDDDFNIVSLPLPKFFNYEEHGTTSKFIKDFEKDGYNIFEKADGSLVVLTKYKEHILCSTRGSWASDQAIWANELIAKPEYKKVIDTLDLDNFTYVYEVIYNENRIVLKYDFENLVILAKINKKTGVDVPYDEFVEELVPPFKRVKHYTEYEHLSLAELKALNLKDKEGFVCQNKRTGQRLKVKMEDYVRLHAIITNVTYRDIWRTLKAGEPLTELYENVPDEFYDWVREKVDALECAFIDKVHQTNWALNHIHSKLSDGYTKKEFAMELFKHFSPNESGKIFALENGKDITDAIWSELYPPHEKPFSV